MAGVGVMIGLLLPVPGALAEIEIMELRMEPNDGGWLVIANIDYDLPQVVTEALDNGVTLHINTDIELVDYRRWWRDKLLYTVSQDWHLQYHAISEKYLLTAPGSEPVRMQFHSLSHALQNMGHVRQKLPALAMNKNGDHRLRLRTRLNTLSLPRSLQLVAQTSQTWRQLARATERELQLP